MQRLQLFPSVSSAGWAMMRSSLNSIDLILFDSCSGGGSVREKSQSSSLPPAGPSCPRSSAWRTTTLRQTLQTKTPSPPRTSSTGTTPMTTTPWTTTTPPTRTPWPMTPSTSSAVVQHAPGPTVDPIWVTIPRTDNDQIHVLFSIFDTATAL